MARTKVRRGLCSVEGCGRPHKSRGYCQTHYMQWKRGVPVVAEIRVRDRSPLPECSEENCSEPVKAKGLCQTHYARLLRHGFTRKPDRTKLVKACAVEGCNSHLYSNGLCNSHYLRERMLKTYGLTLEAADEMLAQQDGKCAICSLPERSRDGSNGKLRELNMDHDHSTGAPRALLCNRCNRGLGYFMDSAPLMATAILYLARHSADPQALIGSAISELTAAQPA